MGSFHESDPNFKDNLKKLGFDNAVFANQIHTDVIVPVTEFPSEIPDADAFITQTKDLPLMVKTADCQGVLMYDPVTNSIAVVHSGWKGSIVNIIGKTVQKLEKEYEVNSSNLLVGISPSLSPNSAEFSDPYNELPAFCHKHILGNGKVDFWALTKEQLLLEGVQEDHIEFTGICSVDDPESFSHRNGDAGRMAVFIALK